MKLSPQTLQRTIGSWIALATLLVVSASAANLHAQLIDVNFTHNETYSGEAVLGSPGDTWNNLVLSSSSATNSTFALVNSANASIATTLTLSGFSGGALPYGNYGNPNTTIAPNLFNSYLYGGSGTTIDGGSTPGSANASLDFAHLAANTSYQLKVYNVNSALFDGIRDSTFTVNGVSETLDFAHDYTAFSSVETSPGVYTGNYISFLVTSDGSGNLDIALKDAGNSTEFDVTGLQLEAQSAPEPSTAAMLFPAITLLLAITACQHRRRARI